MTQLATKNPRFTIIYGLILTAVLFLCFSVGSKVFSILAGPGLSLDTRFIISRLFFWLCFVIILVYVSKAERQRLLLWDDEPYSVGYYILSVIVILLIIVFGSGIIGLTLKRLDLLKFSPTITLMRNMSTPVKLLGIITAGVLEELIFRGYMIPRLKLFFKSGHWPVIISSVIFALGHWGYGTAINVLVPLFIGLVFGYHYYRYRNINILIICHLLIDLNAMFTPDLIKH
ncbi:CPBP family intramembrane glutamic endopeptidase [Mucilaginibacter ginsenosidivorax]|uniref:CPBP family intramembrane metalloprotease n=1 Tax=Mucilaginibacter ginsenosidivorax TaxID=862126 RepID=A0A5B8W1H7_9SPHI|nr:type II CAAX endopeptidase family protein [Mucilaginibacter ginsenosidivorax]QEC76742.1 CPBP family intramembrane metalloprotease [Mucilaginibacter ginsenosidivorax]